MKMFSCSYLPLIISSLFGTQTERRSGDALNVYAWTIEHQRNMQGKSSNWKLYNDENRPDVMWCLIGFEFVGFLKLFFFFCPFGLLFCMCESCVFVCIWQTHSRIKPEKRIVHLIVAKVSTFLCSEPNNNKNPD